MKAEFRGVRDLFNKSGKGYYVPEYQRGFEWERENFEDLWSDIQQIGKE